MNKRSAILLIAYACHPSKGSEEGVGWGWVNAIARRHDVTVITADYHRADIEKACAAGKDQAENITFHYVQSRRWHYRPTPAWKRVEASPFKPIMNLAYAGWLKQAYRDASRLVAQQHYDLVHLITYVGFRFPGQFYKLPLPFVWGPIGGLENTPWQFLPMMGLVGGVYFGVRNVINAVQRCLLPGPKRAFAKAGDDGIIAATPGMAREIRKWYGRDSQVICEIGSPPVVAQQVTRRGEGEPLRLAWSGLHNPGKALPLLLRAVARLPDGLDWELHILGQGRQTTRWKQLAVRLGVTERCQWHGWLPRDQALQQMQQAHVFVITSMHDLTSTVLVEAMAQGLPVICPDAFGFSHVVTDDCGIRLPVQSPRQFQADLARAIEQLGGDEAERYRMGQAALKRVRAFGWDRKADEIERVYQRKLSGSARSVPGGVM